MATNKQAHAVHVKHEAHLDLHKMIISDGTIALSDLLKLLLLLTSFTMQIACFISLHFCLINVLFSELKTYL